MMMATMAKTPTPANFISPNQPFRMVSGSILQSVNNSQIKFHSLRLCHKAGVGYFAGMSFKEGELLGRVGDAAFPVVDQDWHNSPDGASQTKHEAHYHWPLTNYDWNAPDIGMDDEAEDVSVTVNGFGGKIFIIILCKSYDRWYHAIDPSHSNSICC